MNTAFQASPVHDIGVGRHVVFRTRGHAHGPIVRLVSPSDVGGMIKPFVFLDLLDTREEIGQPGFGWHPHSHDLHLDRYSVHTSPAALIEGEREIARIGRELREKGVMR